jgi:hypothetical protein
MVAKIGTISLQPFYRTYDRQYTIFWDTYTEQEWEASQGG